MGTLQFKRGPLANKPELAEGEPYMDETNKKLIIKIEEEEKTFKPDNGVKVYRALLTQSGADAPVVNILENTVGEIIWTRYNAGKYHGTLSNAFPINKTSCNIQNMTSAGPAMDEDAYLVKVEHTSVDYVLVATGLPPTDYYDGFLRNTAVEILVYP